MDQASKLRKMLMQTPAQKTTHFIAITSGKGGVGKSTISANLASVLAKGGYKVGLLDADIGLANLDVILNVKIRKNLLNVLKGECTLADILIQVAPNLTLIPGESGDEILKFNDQFLFERFLSEASVLDGLDFLLIDTGAGIGEHTKAFLEASDEIIVVTVPDPAAITDAYAMIKVASKFKQQQLMLLNQVKNEAEAQRIFNNINRVAVANIGAGLELSLIGCINQDKIVSRSIKSRTLFSLESPNSIPAGQITDVANSLLNRLERKMLVNSSKNSFSQFFRRLIEQF